jgi:hypothetical protein
MEDDFLSTDPETWSQDQRQSWVARSVNHRHFPMADVRRHEGGWEFSDLPTSETFRSGSFSGLLRAVATKGLANAATLEEMRETQSTLCREARLDTF